MLVGGAALLARSPLLLALMAAEAVSEESDSTPSRSEAEPRDDPLEPAHRGRRAVEFDDDDVAGAHRR